MAEGCQEADRERAQGWSDGRVSPSPRCPAHRSERILARDDQVLEHLRWAEEHTGLGVS